MFDRIIHPFSGSLKRFRKCLTQCLHLLTTRSPRHHRNRLVVTPSGVYLGIWGDGAVTVNQDRKGLKARRMANRSRTNGTIEHMDS